MGKREVEGEVALNTGVRKSIVRGQMGKRRAKMVTPKMAILRGLKTLSERGGGRATWG